MCVFLCSLLTLRSLYCPFDVFAYSFLCPSTWTVPAVSLPPFVVWLVWLDCIFAIFGWMEERVCFKKGNLFFFSSSFSFRPASFCSIPPPPPPPPLLSPSLPHSPFTQDPSLLYLPPLLSTFVYTCILLILNTTKIYSPWRQTLIQHSPRRSVRTKYRRTIPIKICLTLRYCQFVLHLTHPTQSTSCIVPLFNIDFTSP